jgi:hypothetical protein
MVDTLYRLCIQCPCRMLTECGSRRGPCFVHVHASRTSVQDACLRSVCAVVTVPAGRSGAGRPSKGVSCSRAQQACDSAADAGAAAACCHHEAFCNLLPALPVVQDDRYRTLRDDVVPPSQLVLCCNIMCDVVQMHVVLASTCC